MAIATVKHSIRIYTATESGTDAPLLSLQVENGDRTLTLLEVAEQVLRDVTVRSASDEHRYLLVIIDDAFTDTPAVRLRIENGLVTSIVPPISSTSTLSTILNPERAAAVEAEAMEVKQRDEMEKFLATRYSDAEIRKQRSRVEQLANAATDAILAAAENRDPVQLSLALTKLHGWTESTAVIRKAALEYQDWETAVVYARRLRDTVGNHQGFEQLTMDNVWYDTKTTIKWWFLSAVRVLKP